MLLGFSTGCLYKTHNNLAKSTIAIFRDMGCNAIEIMCHEVHDIELLLELEPVDFESFQYVSLHTPAFDAYDSAEIVRMLEILVKVNEKLKFEVIVLHPYETINWDVFRQFDLPFVIENMDWQKDFGKYTASLQDIFAKFDVPMALNLNHCYTNDPSMHLTKELFETFGGRIEEIHLSGYETSHDPLYKTKQKEILEAIPDKRIPLIIESVCENVEELQKEFAYVKKFLKK